MFLFQKNFFFNFCVGHINPELIDPDDYHQDRPSFKATQINGNSPKVFSNMVPIINFIRDRDLHKDINGGFKSSLKEVLSFGYSSHLGSSWKYSINAINAKWNTMSWQSSAIKEVNDWNLGVLEKSKVFGVVVEVLVVAVVVVFSRIVDGVVLHLVFSFSIWMTFYDYTNIF